MWEIFMEHPYRHTLDIMACWLLFYFLLSRLRQTRAMQMIKGLIVLLVIFALSNIFKFQTLEHILTAFWNMALLAVVIIFQPELRRALIEMADQPFLGLGRRESKIIDELVRAAFQLAHRRYGALIVIQQEVGLKNFLDSGITLNSKLSSELLITTFTPMTPLHDGAVVIRDDIILAASCILPINEDIKLDSRFGTRHLAGLTLSEETDAIVIIVSEENGSVSLAVSGKMAVDLTPDHLKDSLILYIKKKEKTSLKEWFFRQSRDGATLEG